MKQKLKLQFSLLFIGSGLAPESRRMAAALLAPRPPGV
jgi:hypothetical protein